MQTTRISPDDLRVEILRHWRKPIYKLAALVSIHPATLSGMLRNRLPMPAAVKQRMLVVLAAAVPEPAPDVDTAKLFRDAIRELLRSSKTPAKTKTFLLKELARRGIKVGR